VKASSPIKGKTNIDVLRADSLARVPWLVHGFSTRAGGFSNIYGRKQLNLGFTAQDSRVNVEKNRKTFVASVTRTQFQKWSLITLRQIHSDLIHRVDEIPTAPLSGDGLITNSPGILLAVLTADCLPVVLVDVKTRAIGVFHAGWRGTVKRIAEKGIGEMHRWFGTRPRDVKAAIGPGIRGCCYQVGPEVREAFESQFHYANYLFRETKERDEIHEKYPLLFLTARAPGHSELPKKIFLDIGEANRRQLLAAGVPAKNISDLGLCTFCHPELFFSHRRENGVTGRMMAVAGIR
jgi:polyphenol oxidase